MAGRNEIEILIRARDEASRTLADVNRKLKDLGYTGGESSESVSKLGDTVKATAAGFIIAEAAIAAATAAFHLFTGAVRTGIQSIDDLKTAQASMAAAIASTDLKGNFEDAYETAGNLVQQIQYLDRAFIGTADELTLLGDAMLTFGMGIDLSTKKAQDQFVAFGNMIKLLTRGQDFQRQAYQEIRSLMEGTNVQGALLVKKIEAAGINAKAMIPLWREQGVLLEKIMEILPGYEKAGKKIEATLSAQKSSLETIVKQLLREGMAEAYEDIVGWIKQINDGLRDQNGWTEEGKLLVDLMKDGWDGIKTILVGIGETFRQVILPAIKEMYSLIKATRELQGADTTGVDMFGIYAGGAPRFGLPRQPVTAEGLEMFFGYGPEGGLKVAGAKRRETDEENKERERRLREEEKFRQKQINDTAKYWGEYADLVLGESEKLDKYLRENRLKSIEEDEKQEQARGEAQRKIIEFNAGIISRQMQEDMARLKAIVDNAWGDLLFGMNQAFGDLFFDVFKGKLDSVADYFERFTDVIRNMWANLISDMITEALRSKIETPIKKMLGGLVNTFFPTTAITGAQFGELASIGTGLELFYGYRHGGIIPGPIRAFQAGGIVDRPMFGLFGEGGPEAVIPLKGGKVPVELEGSKGDMNINFTIVAADTRDFDRLLSDRRPLIMGMMNDALRQGGRMRDSIRRHV